MSDAKQQKSQMAPELSENAQLIPGTGVYVTVKPLLPWFLNPKSRVSPAHVKSVKPVSESEYEYDLSGDHGDIDNCLDWNRFEIRLMNQGPDTFKYTMKYEPGKRICRNVIRRLSDSFETESVEGPYQICTGDIRPRQSYKVLEVHMIEGGGRFNFDLLKPRVNGQSFSDWMNEDSSKMLTLRLQSPDEIALALCMLSHERLGAGSAFQFLSDDNMQMIFGFLKN